MKKIYLLLGCMLFLQLSNNLSAQVIFNENFSSATGTTPPAGWVNNDIEGTGTVEVWYFDNPGGQTLNAPIAGKAAIFDSDFNMSSSGPEEAALESPAFDASAVTDFIMLSFDHTFYDDSDNGGTGAVYYVEVWNGTSWVEVLSGNLDTPDPEHVSLNITAAAGGDANAQVRFRWTGDWGYWWIVDNVLVEEVSCPNVSALEVTAVTSNSIDISWTAGGTETDWNIEYGPQGFTPGTGTPGTSTNGSFTAGSLAADSYFDFYVQADCGGGDESAWFGPITGFTGFCEFEGIDSDIYIENFSTTGGTGSNISNLGSGYGTNGYQDATSMVVSSFEGGPDINFTVDNGNGYYLGLSIWVDWNDNLIFESSEQMYTSGFYDETFSGSFGVPLGMAVGSHRMRVLVDGDNGAPNNACASENGYGEAEDYTFEVVPIPSCLPVTDLETANETTNSIDISWTPGDSETDWNIEWGMPGFVPGTGTGVDSAQQSSSASYTVGGLNSSTSYDIYVQASCSSTDSSYWTLVSGTTLCAPITALPWSENFDAMPNVDYNLFPNCWVSEIGDWYTDNASNNSSYNSVPYSGDNYLGIYYSGDDYIATPEFQLTAGKVYEFSFMWAGDGYTGWDGEVFVNDQQASSGATSLGVFVEQPDMTSVTPFKKEIFCFTPTVSGAYSFGIYAYSNGNPWNLAFDDFSLIERQASAGTDGTLNVCQINGLVDLNSIITKDDQIGMWTFDPNPSTIVNDSLFNPQFVPAGTITVNYVTLGCLEDTASAIITIYPPSSAGTDGLITACKNEPIDLHSGLGGNVDMGGDWYNSTNNLMPNSQVITGTFPGSFNYKYISGNTICPNDTSSVVVTVLSNCDWMSVDENAFESVNLYPNPSTGLVYIESDLSTGSFNLVVTDVNGRVVETENNSITNGVNAVNLNNVQRGTYFFKLSNENAEKVYRVVIQ